MAGGVTPSFMADQAEDGNSTHSAIPSWIRLLDPPQPPHHVSTQSLHCPPRKNQQDDTSSQADVSENAGPWYMSPFFEKPVIGYYNRPTRSNLSLAAPPRWAATDRPRSGAGVG
ncbi:uncharacterized protein LOC143288931 [Babylonia areolata]|uniref:uncharacterized protein LOC143288931 n=1 Tax=Babylonia areolata TaxID=304850 RepID=UPI003FD2D3A4